MMATRVTDVPRADEIGERILGGHSRFRLLPFLGPAFIACIAYIDPGNFATNIAGGSKFGYTLLWVIVASNLMAMLIQTLSAKLGIATGRNLPEVCRDRFSRRTTFTRESVDSYFRKTLSTCLAVEPSSAMHSSQCGYDCFRTDSIAGFK